MPNVIVKLNSNIVNFPDKQPKITEDRVFVPLRGLFDELGYNVSWNGSAQTVTIQNSKYRFKFEIGVTQYEITDKAIGAPVPAIAIESPLILATEGQ